MNRQQKEAVVRDVNEMLKDSQATFLVGYKGLTVSKMETLRGELRDENSAIKVAKARLMKIASTGIEGIDEFKDFFRDQVGLVFAKGEVPAVAKKLVEFSKRNEAFSVLSGFFESKLMSQGQIEFLASLPPRDVLLSQLMRAMQSPASGFAGFLNLMIVRLVCVLDQISKKS